MLSDGGCGWHDFFNAVMTYLCSFMMMVDSAAVYDSDLGLAGDCSYYNLDEHHELMRFCTKFYQFQALHLNIHSLQAKY